MNEALITILLPINKGLFPHKFVLENNLNYIGGKPDIKYYFDEHKINEKNRLEYNNLAETFNLKSDCLEYLNQIF